MSHWNVTPFLSPSWLLCSGRGLQNQPSLKYYWYKLPAPAAYRVAIQGCMLLVVLFREFAVHIYAGPGGMRISVARLPPSPGVAVSVSRDSAVTHHIQAFDAIRLCLWRPVDSRADCVRSSLAAALEAMTAAFRTVQPPLRSAGAPGGEAAAATPLGPPRGTGRGRHPAAAAAAAAAARAGKMQHSGRPEPDPDGVNKHRDWDGTGQEGADRCGRGGATVCSDPGLRGNRVCLECPP